MPVECYKQMSTIKEGVIMRLHCTIKDISVNTEFMGTEVHLTNI